MFATLRYACRVLLAASSVLASRAAAQAGTASAPPQPLVMTADNLMAGDARHRTMAAQHGDPNQMLPGDVVRYRLTFTNLRSDSIRNVQFTDPLPHGLVYLAESAKADRNDVTIEYSIDNGQSFSARPMIDELVNGQKVQRPAPPSSYTNVRWSVRGWVKPRASVTAELRAQLPAGNPPPQPGER